MSAQLFNIFKFSGAFIALFATAEYLYHELRFKVEITRKIVHIGGGLIALSFPLFFKEAAPVFILCSSFLVLLIGSKTLGFLPSVNAIDRISRGSFLFPIAVAGSFYIAVLLNVPALYYLPLSIMALGDPMACLIGKRFPIGPYKTKYVSKTLAGSFAFFITAFILSVTFFGFNNQDLNLGLFASAVIMALGTAIAEGITGKGYDNITIPFVAAIVLYFL